MASTSTLPDMLRKEPSSAHSHRETLAYQRKRHMTNAAGHLFTCPPNTWLKHYGWVYEMFTPKDIASIRKQLLDENRLNNRGWTAINNMRSTSDENTVFANLSGIVKAICAAVKKVKPNHPTRTTKFRQHPNKSSISALPGPQGRPDGQFMIIGSLSTDHILKNYYKTRVSPRGHSMTRNEMLDVVSLEEYKLSAKENDCIDVRVNSDD
jgi:hypothetical protein